MKSGVISAIVAGSKIGVAGEMAQYDHWLVTKGKDPSSVPPRGLVPIVLMRKTERQEDLIDRVLQEVDYRIRLFLEDDASPIEVLRASTRPYVVDLVSNLWCRDVRVIANMALPPQRGWQPFGEGEDGIAWTLVNHMVAPELWQGPADGVIPRVASTTIWDSSIEPVQVKIIDY